VDPLLLGSRPALHPSRRAPEMITDDYVDKLYAEIYKKDAKTEPKTNGETTCLT
jgi:hypothetical protein